MLFQHVQFVLKDSSFAKMAEVENMFKNISFGEMYLQ